MSYDPYSQNTDPYGQAATGQDNQAQPTANQDPYAYAQTGIVQP